VKCQAKHAEKFESHDAASKRQ